MTKEELKQAKLVFANLIEQGIKQGIEHTSDIWVTEDHKSACSIGTAWLASEFKHDGRVFSDELMEVFPFLCCYGCIDEISNIDLVEGREAVISWLRKEE
jgi:hypothetical protein